MHLTFGIWQITPAALELHLRDFSSKNHKNSCYGEEDKKTVLIWRIYFYFILPKRKYILHTRNLYDLLFASFPWTIMDWKEFLSFLCILLECSYSSHKMQHTHNFFSVLLRAIVILVSRNRIKILQIQRHSYLKNMQFY